jgi:hypothetical protein
MVDVSVHGIGSHGGEEDWLDMETRSNLYTRRPGFGLVCGCAAVLRVGSVTGDR